MITLLKSFIHFHQIPVEKMELYFVVFVTIVDYIRSECLWRDKLVLRGQTFHIYLSNIYLGYWGHHTNKITIMFLGESLFVQIIIVSDIFMALCCTNISV